MTRVAESNAFFNYDDPLDEQDGVEACAYCGLPADTVDHVIPRSLRYMLTDLGGWRNQWGRITDTVPACKECNSTAGAMVFNTMREKREYIHERIEKRYRSVLRTPRWDEDELDELSPALQEYVRASDELARLTRERLRWRGKFIRENFASAMEPIVDDAVAYPEDHGD